MSCCCQDCDCAVTGCGDGCGAGGGEIVLFGVRMKEDPMRKCLSMNNLSDYQQPHQESSNVAADVSAAGYASADEGGHHRGSGNRERKRGVPWTEEEHKLFLLGLQKVGKGDWRGISRNFVKTRTPTQVASHAQKYFLRRNNLNRRRRRSSLFDITTDSVTAIPMEEGKVHQESKSQLLLSRTQPPPPSLPGSSNITGSQVLPFPVSMGPVLIPVQIENGTGNLTLGHINQVNHEPVIHPISFFPMPNASTAMRANINQISSVDPSPLSLKLSLTSDQNQPSRHSVFQVMPSFNNGDNIISVS